MIRSSGLKSRLDRLTNETGTFSILAIDHRDSLRVELQGEVTDADLARFKAEVMAAVGAQASAVMLEPEYSFPQLITDDVVPSQTGVFCALEAQGYLADPLAGNEWLDNWSPRHVLDGGGDGAKLLILYRSDRPSAAAAQEDLVARTVKACDELDLPLLLEPVPFDVADSGQLQSLVVDSVRRLAPLGPTILKMPYPGSAQACEAVTEACGDIPWVLLSSGVGFELFAQQLAEACAVGCSGFAVGRALWREALNQDSRAETLKGLIPDRFAQLRQISQTARPLTGLVSHS